MSIETALVIRATWRGNSFPPARRQPVSGSYRVFACE
jgi:hypothetical protein